MARTEQAQQELVYSIGLHLRYLRSVAANPSTLDAEIARRKEAIAKHQAEIDRMVALKSTVHSRIEAVEAKLRHVSQLNAINKYKQLLREIAQAQQQQQQQQQLNK